MSLTLQLTENTAQKRLFREPVVAVVVRLTSYKETIQLQMGLVIIGVDHRVAPASLVERIRECGLRNANLLSKLLRPGGVSEALWHMLPGRTEIVVAAPDPVNAAGSVLEFLTELLSLTREEWKTFYRHVDEAAVAHLFSVASQSHDEGAAAQLQSNWAKSLKDGHAGRLLRELAKAVVAYADAVREGHGHGPASSEAARQFWIAFQAEGLLPDSAVIQKEVEAICAEEIASFRRSCGGLMTDEQERAVKIVTARISNRVGEWITRTRPKTEVAVKESSKHGQE